MEYKVGIVGLPNVGKSTLFNALTFANADVSNYPFCTVEPNVGVVRVPDARLAYLEKLIPAKELTYATMKFWDIAGLVKGASHGEGLGNKFLSHIREVDLVLHVVRCFSDSHISHVSSEIEPVRDVEVVSLELMQADLEVVERSIEKRGPEARAGREEAKKELGLLEKLKDALTKGSPLRNLSLSEEEGSNLLPYRFLTMKPGVYFANVDEGGSHEFEEKMKTVADREGAPLISFSAKLEAEIAEMGEEAPLFRKEMGLEESGLEKLISSSFKLLGLITFYTVAGGKVRAWPIPRGTTAPEAAGKVHSDMEEGFIKAEVVSFDELVDCKSMKIAKERGLVRMEGKECVIQDGDVVYFQFKPPK